VARQCHLLGINRSGLYYQPKGHSDDDLMLMKLIDRQYLATPFYGARKIAVELKKQKGLSVNRKRVRRLMQRMGIRAVYRRPRTTKPAPGHKIYPYLLRDMKITRPNQVWAADITYIPMARGFLYLVTIIDWYSRYVISWRLSNTLDTDFCIAALEEALGKGKPEIFNTDQGSYNDNLFIERLWRTVKYEEVYLKAYEDGREARVSLGEYFHFYNTTRPHQSLGYLTPGEVYGNAVENGCNNMVESLVANTVGIAGLYLSQTPILS
jgi:putative transposase